MKKSTIALLSSLTLIGGTLLTGCGNNAPGYTPKPIDRVEPVTINSTNERSLFPTEEGTVWVYDIEQVRLVNGKSESSTNEFVYKIAKSFSVGEGKTKMVLEVFRDGQKTEEQEWAVDETGVFQVSSTEKRIPYTPRQPIVLFPVKLKEAFKWSGTGITPTGDNGITKATTTPTLVQVVDTDLGKMPALALEQKSTFKTAKLQGRSDSTTWLAPKVGIARYRQETAVGNIAVAVTLRLKKFTIGKQ